MTELVVEFQADCKAKFLHVIICFLLSQMHFLEWALLSSCLRKKAHASVKDKNKYLEKFNFTQIE